MPPQPGLPTHDHDCDEGDCGVLYSLYKEIDLPQVCCANVTIISRPNMLVLASSARVVVKLACSMRCRSDLSLPSVLNHESATFS